MQPKYYKFECNIKSFAKLTKETIGLYKYQTVNCSQAKLLRKKKDEKLYKKLRTNSNKK